MTADQYRTAIAELGLSQVSAAKFLGVNARTSRRWVSGQQPVPRAVAILLTMLTENRSAGDLPSARAAAQQRVRDLDAMVQDIDAALKGGEGP